jgi:hypothetical protein
MSNDDIALAHRFFRFLETRLRAGSVTPERPMTSVRIIQDPAWSDIALTKRKIQRLTRYLRVNEGKLIGSTSGKPMGYALCRTPQEFMKMNAHLKSRALKDWFAFWTPVERSEQAQTMDLFAGEPGIQSLMRAAEASRPARAS